MFFLWTLGSGRVNRPFLITVALSDKGKDCNGYCADQRPLVALAPRNKHLEITNHYPTTTKLDFNES